MTENVNTTPLTGQTAPVVDKFFSLPPTDDVTKKVAPPTEEVTTTVTKDSALTPNKKKEKRKKKKVPKVREKMKDGEMVKSEQFTWKVYKLLGSGGFGDVYKVGKIEDLDRKDYAMKTEMVEGDKRLLRLKIEVTVLKECSEQTDPVRKKHFVEFVDRGITDRFKFLVMSPVDPSLDDIRRQYLRRNYSRHTAMNACLQTLKALADLHIISHNLDKHSYLGGNDDYSTFKSAPNPWREKK